MNVQYGNNGLSLLQKIFYFLTTVTLSLGGILIIYFYYAIFWPIPTITINKNPAKILTKAIHAGDNVIYELDFCKHVNLKATVSRSIVDHSIFLLPNTTSQFNKGCKVVNIVLQTPIGILPGTYHIISTFKYQVSSFHEIDTTFSTENFEITN